jgi:hypothetical protein
VTGQARIEPHLDEDGFLDLLHGSRSGERRRLALAHVRACAVCEDSLRRYAADHERARIAAARVLGGAHPIPSRGDGAAAGLRSFLQRLLRPRPAFALAASAAIVAIVLLAQRPERPDPALTPMLRWLPDATSLLVGRDATSAPADAWRDGLRSYADHDAGRAARLLERGRADGSFGVLRNVYLGSALAGWTLYVALRGGGMAARADSVLTTLATRQDSVGERARAVRRPPHTP